MKRKAKKIISLLVITLIVLNTNSFFVSANENLADNTMHNSTTSDDSKISIDDVDVSGEHVEGQVLIKFAENKDEDDIEDVVEEIDGEIIQSVELDEIDEEIACVEIPDDKPIEEAICELQNDKNIVSAQPNYIYKTCTTPPVNDPYYKDQYHLRYNDNEKGANIDKAWEFIKNNKIALTNTRIAVIDSGADVDHPDLTKSINKQLSAEIVPVDKKGNYQAYPLIGDGNFYVSPDDQRAISHGTHVTGIIAATANNNVGVSGVATGIDNEYLDTVVIDCMDSLDQYGNPGACTTYCLLDSIDYALKNDCKIINMSLGAPIHDDSIDEACEKCYKKGVIVVAAAGNDYQECYTTPGAYSKNIGVINTNKYGEKDYSSTYGSWYSISAPGTNVLSTYAYPTTRTGRLLNEQGNAGYARETGTSMATPVVTGICAMCLAINPKITSDQMKYIITSTARDLNTPGFDNETAYGLIDAAACVEKAYKTNQVILTANQTNDITAHLEVTNIATEGKNEEVQFAVWSDDKGQDDIRWYKATLKDGKYICDVPLKNHKSVGIFNVHCYFKSTNGQMCFIKSTTFTIDKPTCDSLDVENIDYLGNFKCAINTLKLPAGLSEAKIAVWSTKNGQDDLKWYKATLNKDTNQYEIKGSISSHKYELGEYNFHCYITDANGCQSYLKSSKKIFTLQDATLNLDLNSEKTICTASSDISNVPGGIKSVQFAVWSDTNGQDDLRWYDAIKKNGKYTWDVSLNNHKSVGTFNVHCYATNNKGQKYFVKSTTFSIAKPTCESLDISYTNDTGAFSCEAKKLNSDVGVKELKIAVWSTKNGQDDLRWYSIKKPISSYKISSSISNHKYDIGEYNFHCYIIDENNCQGFIKSKKLNFKVQDTILETSLNSNKTKCTVTSNLSKIPGGIKEVQFAVWSDDKGQDDIRWYKASIKNGTYTYDVPLSSHKSVGTFNVHCYATNNKGQKYFVKSTTFSIAKPTCESLDISYTNATGAFSCEAKKLNSDVDVKELKVAVWSTKNGQDDLKWYKATLNKKTNQYEINGNISSHKYELGEYNFHCYITDDNGCQSFVKSAKKSF